MEKSLCTFQFLKIVFQSIFIPNISSALEKLEDNLKKIGNNIKIIVKILYRNKYNVERKLNR